MDMYDIARQITDEVMGEGTYADVNKGNPDPRVQAAINRGGMMPVRHFSQPVWKPSNALDSLVGRTITGPIEVAEYDDYGDQESVHQVFKVPTDQGDVFISGDAGDGPQYVTLSAGLTLDNALLNTIGVNLMKDEDEDIWLDPQ